MKQDFWIQIIRPKFLTYKNFTEITSRYCICIIVAVKSTMLWLNIPVIGIPDNHSMIVQSVVIARSNAPFTNVALWRVGPPLLADLGWFWVVVFHSDKRFTRVWLRICLTAEVLDHSFSDAIGGCGHVERTLRSFAAMESQLSKIQVCSELIHGRFCQKHVVPVILADSMVRPLNQQRNGLTWVGHHKLGNEKPASWNSKGIQLSFSKECVRLRSWKIEIYFYRARICLDVDWRNKIRFFFPIDSLTAQRYLRSSWEANGSRHISFPWRLLHIVSLV